MKIILFFLVILASQVSFGQIMNRPFYDLAYADTTGFNLFNFKYQCLVNINAYDSCHETFGEKFNNWGTIIFTFPAIDKLYGQMDADKHLPLKKNVIILMYYTPGESENLFVRIAGNSKDSVFDYTYSQFGAGYKFTKKTYPLTAINFDSSVNVVKKLFFTNPAKADCSEITPNYIFIRTANNEYLGRFFEDNSYVWLPDFFKIAK